MRAPDCVADFTTIQIEQAGDDRVAISGIRGYPPTPTYKVSMSYANGYKILGTLCISGPDAADKAHVLADMVWQRTAMHGYDIPEEHRFLELFGTNVLYKGLVPSPEQPVEIMMRIGARSDDATAINNMGTDLAPLVVNEINLIGSRCGPFSEAIAATAPESTERERGRHARATLVEIELERAVLETVLPRLASIRELLWIERRFPMKTSSRITSKRFRVRSR